MNPIEELMSKRWIIRSDNPETYYAIRDSIKEKKKILQEKFGYSILSNQHLVKLEKIPSKAEPWMGIQDFTSVKEYQIFCIILMFLEDKEIEEQFVLSNLTEYIQIQLGENEIDWTSFSQRKQLIRCIKHCLKISLIKRNDGDEDKFSQNVESEALYENTGYSRYYMRSFSHEIMEYQTPQDFMKSEWVEMDEDRGIIRRQRIYRRLLLSLGIYHSLSDKDEDFQYIRHYRNQIETDFQSLFPCQLHTHSSSAFIVLHESCSMGRTFPQNNTYHDLILILSSHIRNLEEHQNLKTTKFERIELTEESLKLQIKRVIKENFEILPKQYKLDADKKLVDDIIEIMKNLGMLECHADKIILYPILGKVIGEYNVQGGANNESK